MNDLYLIGNGFDLAHGLKTSYNDFLLWYLKCSISRITPQKHFEDELLIVNRRFNNPLEDHTSLSELFAECEKFQITVEYKYPFFEQIVKNYLEYKWVDVEYEYYMALVSLYKRLEKAGVSKHQKIDAELESLNNCLDSIKKKLVEYLKGEDGKTNQKSLDIENILFEGTGVEGRNKGIKSYVYFNYTSTLAKYIQDKWRDPQDYMVHIHGKLNGKDDSVIFGYGDEIDSHYEKIENLNSNEFLRHIKSFNYFKTSEYQRVIRFLASGKFTVKILGHSCGISDRILLNTIFEHPNCQAIKIYYHQKSETENDYFEKTQEISRHFKASGKGDMRTKIVPFNQSIPLIPFVPIN